MYACSLCIVCSMFCQCRSRASTQFSAIQYMLEYILIHKIIRFRYFNDLIKSYGMTNSLLGLVLIQYQKLLHAHRHAGTQPAASSRYDTSGTMISCIITPLHLKTNIVCFQSRLLFSKMRERFRYCNCQVSSQVNKISWMFVLEDAPLLDTNALFDQISGY